jgi:hypothetical protein
MRPTLWLLPANRVSSKNVLVLTLLVAANAAAASTNLLGVDYTEWLAAATQIFGYFRRSLPAGELSGLRPRDFLCDEAFRGWEDGAVAGRPRIPGDHNGSISRRRRLRRPCDPAFGHVALCGEAGRLCILSLRRDQLVRYRLPGCQTERRRQRGRLDNRGDGLAELYRGRWNRRGGSCRVPPRTGNANTLCDTGGSERYRRILRSAACRRPADARARRRRERGDFRGEFRLGIAAASEFGWIRHRFDQRCGGGAGDGSVLALDAAGNAYVSGTTGQLYPVRNSTATCLPSASSNSQTGTGSSAAGTAPFLTVVAPDGSISQITYLPGAAVTPGNSNPLLATTLSLPRARIRPSL